MSYMLKFPSLTPPIETLTGNTGGAISPYYGNIDIVGDGTSIIVAGDPISYSLTISAPLFADSFITDSGTAQPSSGDLNVLGTTNEIETSGAGNTVTIGLPSDVIITDSLTVSTGNATLTLGDFIASAGGIDVAATVVAGTGITSTLGDIEAVAGKLIAGDEITAVNNITTSTGDIVSTLGAGSFATSVTVGNTLHVLAGGGDIVGTLQLSDLINGVLETDASGNISATALTEHALYVGDASGNLNGVAVGATGEVLIGNTTADPSWSSTPSVTSLTATTVYGTTFDTNVAAAAVTLTGTTLSADGTDANIDINITSKGTGQVVINDLKLTTDLAVTEGGTGASTLTDNGVLYGNGTAAIGATAEGATSTVLVGNTNFPPYFTGTPSVTSLTATTIYATTVDTNVDAAAVTLSGTTLSADGTDANIDINITPKGTGVLSTTELNLTTDLAVQYGGTGVSTLTQYGVLVGNAATDIQALAVGATNQVLLGNTGANPSWGTVGNSALTNSSVTLSNGANITVTGSPLSLGGTATIALSGTTDHAVQVGNASGSVTSLAVGATNQVLLGNTGADPSWGSVDLTTDITGTLPVGNGGTGATTLTDNGLLYGNSTSAVAALSEATNGQIPIGSTGNPPTLATISEGTNIDVVNASGSITLSTTKVEINAQTGTSYTLVLGDAGKLVTCSNAAAIILTVPPNSSVAFPVGTVITISQIGAGTVTLTEGSGVTINSLNGNLDTSGQYAGVALHKLATDSWLALGSLA